MIPINKHLKIRPLETEAFMSSSRTTFEEIGIVLEVAEGVDIPKGSKVYFESWLAKKFPISTTEDAWFVPYEDVVAYEPVSK